MNHNNNDVTFHGSIKTNIVCLVLSIILTLIPFWMVVIGCVSKTAMLYSISLTAIMQIIMHLIYFLHMNTKSNRGWNLTAFVFTMIIITILVGGSIWIMRSLSHNMIAV